MTNRADQAGLVVQDIARSSVIPKHRYKLDAKTRAVIAISAKTPPFAPGKPRRGARKAAEQRRAAARWATRKKRAASK